jgi:hypothetical protein
VLGSIHLRLQMQVARARLARATAGRLLGLSAATFIALTMACAAGPCSTEIATMQARLNARLAAAAAAAPSAPESATALRHRQPTPRSVASALVALGVLSREKAKIIGQAMAQARQADQAGDKAACERALDEVERTIGP